VRYETCSKDMGEVLRVADRIASTLGDVSIHCSARLGANGEQLAGNSLPFTPASSVRPGM